MTMHYASITTRLAGLGSDKWHVHIKAKELRRQGKPVIMLTIGEPDIAVSEALMTVLERSMRAGRTGYSNGRGEPSVLNALAAKYSTRAGRLNSGVIWYFASSAPPIVSVAVVPKNGSLSTCVYWM